MVTGIMAYTFFPKSAFEIKRELEKNKFPEKNIDEIMSLFMFLKNKSETPINIDFKQRTVVNVARDLKSDYTIADIKRGANLTVLKPKFGNGSSGNRGANNRGNLFEPKFAEALLQWWAGEKVSDGGMLKAIEDLNNTYRIDQSKTFKVDVVGGDNVKRPLSFSPKIEITNPRGGGFDVGETVTDITLTLDKNRKIFLSLKLGGTTTFFNVGVKTVMPTSEIKNGLITNNDGKKLLDLFGIDNETFCSVFNGTLGKGKKVRASKFDKAGLENLLQSGIGFNYHIIHKKPGRIISKEMSQAAMKKASKITGTPTIYYGGKTGTGKRVDIEFETPSYIFKINLRDTQGKDGYPTRMMCDFKDK